MLSVHEQAALKSAVFQFCLGHNVLVVGPLVVARTAFELAGGVCFHQGVEFGRNFSPEAMNSMGIWPTAS